MILIFILLIILYSTNAFTTSFIRCTRRSSQSRLDLDMKKEKKDLGRLLQTIIFPNIYADYEDTKDLGSQKEEIKIKTQAYKEMEKEFARPSYKKVKGEDMTDGKFKTMDDKVYTSTKGAEFVDTISKLGAPKKPIGFKPNKPSSLKLGIASGPGATCGTDINSWPKPKKPLLLYEYEGQGASRKVREACSYLDLVIEVRPSPGGRYGWSDDQARITGGERVLPFMVDSSSAYTFRLRKETEIIEYLFENYGPGIDKIPGNLKGKGGGDKNKVTFKNARPDFTKFKPVILYTIEGCSASKSVRETLDGLAIPHKIIFCAKGGKNREALTKKLKGNFQVPYIVDGNTKCELFESKEITKYLIDVYADPRKK